MDSPGVESRLESSTIARRSRHRGRFPNPCPLCWAVRSYGYAQFDEYATALERRFAPAAPPRSPLQLSVAIPARAPDGGGEHVTVGTVMAGRLVSATMLDVGQPAPAFTLDNQDGEPVSLADFTGRPVVVYFYPRADTAGCTTEACGFRDAWTDYEEAGAAILGISDDPVEDLAAFHEKYDLPFDLLSDPDGEVGSAYGSYGEKTMYGNTFDGVFRNTYLVSPTRTIAAVYPKVDPEGHADTVLDDVSALV